MKITNHHLRDGLYIDLEISNIQWENDSIGAYEYWGSKEYDRQSSYVSYFEIDEIVIENVKITQQTLIDFLTIFIMDNQELYTRIEKELIEDAAIEKGLRRRENREAYC